MGEKQWAEIFGSEWEYICRLGKAFSDPEEKKAFWETVKQKKQDDPRYSIYSDFPTARDKKNLAIRYCGEILEMLKGRKREESDVG